MKRNYSLRLSAMLLVVSFLLLPSCARKKGPIELTIVLKTTIETAEFWTEVMDGVNSAVEEYEVALTITGASAETEVDEQIAIMEDVIETDPDVIILVSSDFDRMVPVTEQAVDAGIHVVTMDSDVNTDARTCYVASNNYQIGCMMGKQLLNFIDAGKVAVMSHSPVASSGIDRPRGAVDTLSHAEDIEIVGIYDCANDMEQASSITDQILQEHPDLAAFVCINEVCNRAVANRLVEEGLAGDILIVGCDNSQQQIQYLEQNAIQAIVIQRPFHMGYMAITQAVKVAHGETVPVFSEIPCVSITQDNMYNSDIQKLLFPF